MAVLPVVPGMCIPKISRIYKYQWGGPFKTNVSKATNLLVKTLTIYIDTHN